MLQATSLRTAWRRTLAAVCALLLLLSAPALAAAATPVLVDGRALDFDAPPRVIDGRTLVPMRAIFEALGAEVLWDSATRTVTGIRGATTVTLSIGSTQALLSGQPATLDVPAQIFAGRTFVPLRFVGEALGADVVWDDAAGAVRITSPAPAPAPAPEPTPEPAPEPAPEPEPTPEPEPEPEPEPTPEPEPEPAPAGPPAGTWEPYAVAIDAGTRLQGIVPYALRLDDGRIRLYYAGGGGILSAISDDGLNFSAEGQRLAATTGMEHFIGDPTVLRDAEGRYRLYYKAAEGGGSPSQAKHRTFSAVSDDGLQFTRQGLAFAADRITSVPEATLLDDGRVRLYFVHFDPTVSEHNNRVMSAVSTDGVNFTMESGPRLAQGFVDPSITRLPDGRYMMVSYYIPEFVSPGAPRRQNGVYALFSEDGLTFSDPVLLLASAGMDPATVAMADGQYRVYYWDMKDNPSVIRSFTFRLRFVPEP